MRRWRDHAIFIMGIPILARRHLHIEPGSRCFMTSRFCFFACRFHVMETLSALMVFCEGTSSVIAELSWYGDDITGKHLPFVWRIHWLPFPSIRTSNVEPFSYNKLLNQQCSCRWYETQWRLRDVTVMRNGLVLNPQLSNRTHLTHWGRDKIDAISQTTFSRAFSSMKIVHFD